MIHHAKGEWQPPDDANHPDVEDHHFCARMIHWQALLQMFLDSTRENLADRRQRGNAITDDFDRKPRMVAESLYGFNKTF